MLRTQILCFVAAAAIAAGCNAGAPEDAERVTPSDRSNGRGGAGGAAAAPDGGGAGVGGAGGDDEEGGGAGGEGGAPPLLAPMPCASPAAPTDTTGPTATVGTGSPESCTEAAFAKALAGGGTIRFHCGEDAFTLIFTTEKVVRVNTVIDGQGRIALSGGQETRLFTIHGAAVTLQNLTVEDGLAVDKDVGGGAIRQVGGVLTVINCRFLHNRAARAGASVAGGAIFASAGAKVVIVGSLFTGNLASNGGAVGARDSELALWNSTWIDNDATGADVDGEGGNGGALSVESAVEPLILCGSTVSKNRATARGGGLYRAATAGARTTIDRSTFDANTSLPEGKPGQGGGVYLEGSAATITSATLSENLATTAGGLYLGVGGHALTNVTISGNRAVAGAGGGLFAGSGAKGTLLNVSIARNEVPDASGTGGGVALDGAELTLTNSIVAYNQTGGSPTTINCAGKMANGGGNLQFPVSSGGSGIGVAAGLCAEGAIVEDPLLDELADNGGPTLTAAVRPGSPAIDRATTGCPSTDQRNRPRPVPCTAGALEAR